LYDGLLFFGFRVWHFPGWWFGQTTKRWSVTFSLKSISSQGHAVGWVVLFPYDDGLIGLRKAGPSFCLLLFTFFFFWLRLRKLGQIFNLENAASCAFLLLFILLFRFFMCILLSCTRIAVMSQQVFHILLVRGTKTIDST